MSKLLNITKDYLLTKEEFFTERRKHLQKKGLSAKRIYRTEKSFASLYKVPLEGWQEYLLLYGGFIMPFIIGIFKLPYQFMIITFMCFITLIVKVFKRRRKMWQKRYSYLT